MTLPDGRDKAAEELDFLNVCHRRQKHRLTVASILWSEDFFDAMQRPSLDAWEAIYNQEWEGIKGADILSALRDHLASLQGGCCCYCMDSLLKGGHSRPIEHVLPRADFPRFSFHFWNVAVSCERCNRLKKTGGYESIPVTAVDYPDHQAFIDCFHPRFHVHKAHVWFSKTGCSDYYYVIYRGLTPQGRALVDGVLADVAAEVTRESTDPSVRDDVKRIRQFAAEQSEPAQRALADFEKAWRQAFEIGAA